MSKVETTLYSIGDDKLTAIADAIRNQTETDDTMTTDRMVTNINNMMTAIAPYISKYQGVPYEAGEFAMYEVEDPDYGEEEFDSERQIIFMPGLVERGEITEHSPEAGIHLRKGGRDKYIKSMDICLDITFTNPDDHDDRLNSQIFHGQFDGAEYNWSWYDEGLRRDAYEITIDRPVEDTTYDVKMWAHVDNNSDFDLDILSSEIVECQVTIRGTGEVE